MKTWREGITLVSNGTKKVRLSLKGWAPGGFDGQEGEKGMLGMIMYDESTNKALKVRVEHDAWEEWGRG